MAAVLDPSKPFSAELHVIRQLNSSRCWADGLEPGCAAHSLLGGSRPLDERVSLAPLRNDIPLLDPCSGHLSAGAEVHLGVKGRSRFVSFRRAASAQRVSPGFRQKLQSGTDSSGFSVEWSDLSNDKAWNSRRSLDPAFEARLRVQPQSLRTLHGGSLPDTRAGPQDGFSPGLRPRTENSAAVQRFRAASAAQRSCGDVCFEKFPSESASETLADPVGQRPSSRRYHSRPQLWQSVGGEWGRQQLRSRHDAKKPILFCSGSPRSGQIPGYTGAIGSESMDDIDNGEKDFKPLTLSRSIVPPYTPTSRRAIIPGYTGKAAYENPATARAAVSAAPTPARTTGAHGHAGTLSRMVTPTTPCNPFLTPALLRLKHKHTRRH